MSELVRANSTSSEQREITRAATLVKLGAQLQVLEAETQLPRQRLLRLYKQVHQKLPPAETSPILADWFMNWQPNTHASVFLNVYEFLADASHLDQLDALVWSYQLYREQLKVLDLPEVLSINHAWRLLKYVDSGQLTLKPCFHCAGSFVVYTLDLHELFVCLLCQTPERARNSADVLACARAERLN